MFTLAAFSHAARPGATRRDARRLHAARGSWNRVRCGCRAWFRSDATFRPRPSSVGLGAGYRTTWMFMSPFLPADLTVDRSRRRVTRAAYRDRRSRCVSVCVYARNTHTARHARAQLDSLAARFMSQISSLPSSRSACGSRRAVACPALRETRRPTGSRKLAQDISLRTHRSNCKLWQPPSPSPKQTCRKRRLNTRATPDLTSPQHTRLTHGGTSENRRRMTSRNRPQRESAALSKATSELPESLRRSVRPEYDAPLSALPSRRVL